MEKRKSETKEDEERMARWRVAGGGWRVAGGGRRAAGGGWRVAGGGWRVAGGGWGAGGGWRVAGGGWWRVGTRGRRVDRHTTPTSRVKTIANGSLLN
jgi:hypothetical protein